MKLELSNFVGYNVKSQHRVTNHPQNERGQGHVTHFKFWSPNDTSRTAEARVFTFCLQVGYMKSYLTDDKPSLKEAYSGSHDPF